MNPYIVIRLCK